MSTMSKTFYKCDASLFFLGLKYKIFISNDALFRLYKKFDLTTFVYTSKSSSQSILVNKKKKNSLALVASGQLYIF